MKIVSLSFDDGTIYDKRFIDLLNKYGLKATFNLNSGLDNFIWYYEDKPIRRLNLEESKDIYNGHEVASHSLTHPYFSSLDEKRQIQEVEEDILNLEKIFSRKIEGFAFPFIDQTEANIQVVKNNIDLKYIRCSIFTEKILPKDRYHVGINALYDDKDIYEKLERYKSNILPNSLFVIAGHSYEFEVKNDWEKIEKLLKYLKENDELLVLPLIDAIKLIFR
ncbi:MAG: polysaccharide deacetylase family protein [Bacilli bacterium]|nr:polysaccharide deacetylase family protein [Bacilli bacterium]